MLGLAGVVAHQGGWDEALPIALPVAVLAVLVGVSIRRANRDDGGSDAASRPPDHGAGPT